MADENLDFTGTDTDLLRSPNVFADNTGTSNLHAVSDLDVSTPTASDVINPARSKGSKAVSENVLQLLEYAATAQGVMMTEIMANTAVALSYKLGVDADSLEWFVAGITFANNNMMMEKMVSAIKDLQVEVRNIQVASNGIKGTSEEFMSKIKANKNEIVKELGKTRDAVLATVGSMTPREEIYQEKPKTVTIGMSTGKKNQQLLAASLKSQEVNPALQSISLTSPISTKSPEETIKNQKEKLLIDLGFEADEVSRYTPLAIDFIVSDTMLKIASQGLTQEIKDALVDEALDNQIALIQIEGM